MDSQNKVQIFQCARCLFLTQEYTKLEGHIMEKHKKAKMETLTLTGLEMTNKNTIIHNYPDFIKKENLFDEESDSENEKTNIKKNKQKFQMKVNLKNSKEVKNVECSYCQKEFSTNKSRKIHETRWCKLKAVHNKSSENNTCFCVTKIPKVTYEKRLITLQSASF